MSYKLTKTTKTFDKVENRYYKNFYYKVKESPIIKMSVSYPLPTSEKEQKEFRKKYQKLFQETIKDILKNNR